MGPVAVVQPSQDAGRVFDATIPVLDMNDWYSSNPLDRKKFVQQLSDALREVGFFATINTGADIPALDRAYTAMTQFFALDDETKKKAQPANPEHFGLRGFVPGEKAQGETRKDYKQFYHFGREKPSDAQVGVSRNWPNVWPEDVDLKTPFTELFTQLEAHTIPIQEAIAEALELPRDFFTSMTRDGNVLGRGLYYPADPPADSIWGAAHTDIDLLTILPKATADGLEVRNKKGEWVRVRVPEHSFIFNGGDLLQNITNGYFRSSVHRVMAVEGQVGPRHSMVMFVHPRSKDEVSPLPSLIVKTGGIARFPKATEEERLLERLVSLDYADDVVKKIVSECGIVDRMIDCDTMARESGDEVKALLEGTLATTSTMQKLREKGLASPKVLQELERRGA